jgi:hypothetical protein
MPEIDPRLALEATAVVVSIVEVVLAYLYFRRRER